MTADTRRVAIFIIVGLLAAVGVGVSVWQLSAPETTLASSETTSSSNSPSTRESSSTALNSSTTRPNPRSTSQRRPAPEIIEETPTDPARSGRELNARTEDPFLAPNAVVNTEKQEAEPTRIYRPGNISESDDRTDGDTTGTTDQFGASQTGQPGESGQPTTTPESSETTGSESPSTEPSQSPSSEPNSEPSPEGSETTSPQTPQTPGSSDTPLTPVPQRGSSTTPSADASPGDQVSPSGEPAGTATSGDDANGTGARDSQQEDTGATEPTPLDSPDAATPSPAPQPAPQQPAPAPQNRQAGLPLPWDIFSSPFFRSSGRLSG